MRLCGVRLWAQRFRGGQLKAGRDLGVRAVGHAGENLAGKLGSVSSRGRKGRGERELTCGPGRAEREALREGGDGLTGGADLSGRGRAGDARAVRAGRARGEAGRWGRVVGRGAA